jgi:hypothetical protein
MLPSLAIPYMDILLPQTPKERTDNQSALRIFPASTSNSSWNFPFTDSDEPKRAKALIESELPRYAESKVDNIDPALKIP